MGVTLEQSSGERVGVTQVKREGTALEREGTARAKGLYRGERGRGQACALEVVEG